MMANLVEDVTNIWRVLLTNEKDSIKRDSIDGRLAGVSCGFSTDGLPFTSGLEFWLISIELNFEFFMSADEGVLGTGGGGWDASLPVHKKCSYTDAAMESVNKLAKT